MPAFFHFLFLPSAAGRVVVVSASTDSSVRLWDLWSHQVIALTCTNNCFIICNFLKQLRLIEASSPISSLDFMYPASDGFPLVATAGKACAVFSLATGMDVICWGGFFFVLLIPRSLPAILEFR